MQKNLSMFLKVAIFTSGPLALPTIFALRELGVLANVVLGGLQKKSNSQNYDYDLQFVAELNHAGVAYTPYDAKQTATLLEHLTQWEANLGVIIGFPEILPRELLNFFTHGVYNLHASALPKYRGPMPLYWQIRNQETETAITLHKATAGVDAGEIMIQQNFSIHPRDTLYSLAAQVAERTPQVLQEFLLLLQTHGEVPAGTPQQGQTSYAPRPQQKDICVNWRDMTAAQIAAMTRAGNAGFGTTLFIRNKPLVLLQATESDHPGFGTPPGTVLHIGEPEGFIVATKDRSLRLDIVSSAEGFFSGVAFAERFGLDAGMVFETLSNPVF